MEKINPFAYLYYHLYLLQLEEYDIVRFLSVLLRTKAIPPKKLRKRLVFTPKMLLILVMTLAMVAVCVLTVSYLFLFILYLSFIPILLAVIVLVPLDMLLKSMRIEAAKDALTHYPKLIVIGIAGSYGKTTMKEAVSTILAQKYRVVKTPENINTPLGIANVIVSKVDEKTEVLVVEMGEYKQGDIKHICSLVKPQIGIITGINEAHLERMGSLENTVSAIFELAGNMDKDGLLLLNDDCLLVHEHYKKFITHQEIILYSSTSEQYLQSGLLGSYAKGVLTAAEAVAKKLDLTVEQIRAGALAIKPLPHRLQPIEGSQGVLVIDDSYNGNPEGVKEAIELLSTYADRRKVFVTPGLVETGKSAAEIHRNIGKQLSGVAQLVVLIENSVTKYIEAGLLEGGFKKEDIRWYKSAEKAHAAIGSIIEPNDVVLFQNDWPDNYI